jgi:hypothetical protein
VVFRQPVATSQPFVPYCTDCRKEEGPPTAPPVLLLRHWLLTEKLPHVVSGQPSKVHKEISVRGRQPSGEGVGNGEGEGVGEGDDVSVADSDGIGDVDAAVIERTVTPPLAPAAGA